jgi:molybdate transport system substrate-binding protein
MARAEVVGRQNTPMPTRIRLTSRRIVSRCLQTILLLGAALLGAGNPAPAQSTPSRAITLAAASDLQFALPRIAAAYTEKTGQTLQITYGSSGNLSAQIANGAPFDVLLSADATYPKSLISSGNAVPDSLTLYARGCLVVWFGPAIGEPQQATVAALATPVYRHIAIANPKHAPYGRAAVAALKSAGVYDAVAPKLVLGENISQTAQFVESGNADAGLVALSLLQAAPSEHKGVWKLVPLESYPPLDQAAVITMRGAKNPTARGFVEFLKSPEAQKILQRYGFRPPSSRSAR